MLALKEEHSLTNGLLRSTVVLAGSTREKRNKSSFLEQHPPPAHDPTRKKAGSVRPSGIQEEGGGVNREAFI